MKEDFRGETRGRCKKGVYISLKKRGHPQKQKTTVKENLKKKAKTTETKLKELDQIRHYLQNGRITKSKH